MMCSRCTIGLKVVNRPFKFMNIWYNNNVAANFIYLFCVHNLINNYTPKIEIHSSCFCAVLPCPLVNEEHRKHII